jgi:hypothetical protein
MILDDIVTELKRHCIFDKEEQYTANALWIASSYFLKYQSVPVFNAFPMLAFMSPEPDSGKSRALKVTELLACNSISAGKYTPASLLAKIDESKDDPITICLDEIDTVFAHGKDNSELIQLFNLGYERNATITRMRRFADGYIETPAYCPKVFAGLSVAKIPGPTKTRTIIVETRPKTDDETVERHIDFERLKQLSGQLANWAETVKDQLVTMELPDIEFLNNRSRQLWEPLLAVAKVSSDGWYQRAIDAARYFTSKEHIEKNLSHSILRAAYRVFRTGLYPGHIHSFVLIEQLHELGIPSWIDQYHLSEHLGAYDPNIKPRQIKIGGLNRNGYDWHTFFNAWNIYIKEKEVKDIEEEIGIRTKEVGGRVEKAYSS